MNRIGKGLGSLTLLAVLLVGIPAALVFFAGNPIPSWNELVSMATLGRDYTGSFIMGTVLPIAVWVAWLSFAIGFFAELPAQLGGQHRRRAHKRLPLIGFQQKAMGALLAAVIALFAPAGAFAMEAPAASATTISASAVTTGVSHVEVVAQASAVQAGPKYTVTGTDTLARIADATLGDRGRASEISAMNMGVRQADGGALDTTGFVHEGWILTLPADAKLPTPAEAAQPTSTTKTSLEKVTVESGDTLWGIAEDKTGSGENYHAIVDATNEAGGKITNPYLIYPGETVIVPVETTVAAAPVAPPAPAAPSEGSTSGSAVHGDASTGTDATTHTGADATAPGTGASGLGFTTQTPAPQSQQAPAGAHKAVDEISDNTGTEDSFNAVTTVGGIGGVLAAGILTLLGWRRLKQRRERKPRQRIAMPNETMSNVELELRAVENPAGAEAVDTALRHLAVWAQETGNRLPALYALRLDESSVAVYLDEDADLPAPFTQFDVDDKLAWMVAHTDLEPLDRVPSAPYPALVMLGHDDNNGHIFVDLERIGALNVTGASPDMRHGVLTAIAIELAANTWSEDVQVTLVGVGDRLPLAIGSGRVRHVDDTRTLLRNLRGQAAAIETALAELGVDGLEQARTTGVDAEAWAPEIIILGDDPDDATREAISELVTRIPRVGIAAVSAGHLTGSWNLALTENRRAQLEIPGTDVAIPLAPQLIGPREYNEILALFDVATAGAPTGVALNDELDLDLLPAAVPEDEPALVVVDAVVVDDVATEAAAEAATEVAADAEDVADDDDAIEASEDAGEEKVREAVAEAADDDAPLAAVIPLHSGPYLQVLGPVEVRGARGETPVNPNTAAQWRSAIRRGTELVTFLTMTPGATAEHVHAVFWPGQLTTGKKANDDRNGLLSKTRRWLGQNDDGDWYVPYITTGEYLLHEDVRSDWMDFNDLVGDDISAASTENLAAALELVKGQPISGVPDKRYVFADLRRSEMIAMIGDVAHEAATRGLTAGKVRLARMASAIGRMVDPVNEVFWRDGLRAEHQAGDLAGVERLITQLEQNLAAIDEDFEFEPETQALVAQLRRRHAIAS